MEKEWQRRRQDSLNGMDFVESDRPEAPPKPAPMEGRRLEDRFEKISEQINELSKLVALKTERLSIRLKLAEERAQNFVEDVQNKIAAISLKLNDKPRMDLKVQEVIEKHNQVVRTFENRLGQLKRIVENQEAELYKAISELQEARKEIARLKRQ